MKSMLQQVFERARRAFRRNASTITTNDPHRILLHDLPIDILRMIIVLRLDTITELRLISPLFNNLVKEEFGRRLVLPTIDELIFTKITRFHLGISVKVPSEYLDVYSSFKLMNPTDRTKVDNHTILYFSAKNDDTEFFENLRKATSLRIKDVRSIYINDGSFARRVFPARVKELIQNVLIDRISFHTSVFDCIDGVTLLHDIRSHHTEIVEIRLSEAVLSDPRAFLLQLAAQVKKLVLIQDEVPGPRRKSYLFGMRNVDWAELLSEMFERGVEMITIGNMFYPEYLPYDRSEVRLAKLNIAEELISTRKGNVRQFRKMLPHEIEENESD